MTACFMPAFRREPAVVNLALNIDRMSVTEHELVPVDYCLQAIMHHDAHQSRAGPAGLPCAAGGPALGADEPTLASCGDQRRTCRRQTIEG